MNYSAFYSQLDNRPSRKLGQTHLLLLATIAIWLVHRMGTFRVSCAWKCWRRAAQPGESLNYCRPSPGVGLPFGGESLVGREDRIRDRGVCCGLG
jgi:hypothetical protein